MATPFETYLASHDGSILFGILITTFLVGMIWESFWPRRPESPGLRYRWANNLVLTFLNHGLWHWSGALLGVGIAWWTADRGFGILQKTDLGLAGSFLLVLLTLELTTYLLHRMAHRVPILWRLHAMHHSDVEVDVTTTYRHHPIENLVAMLLTAPAIVALGAPVGAMVLYLCLRQVVDILSHGNIRIPERLERWLRYLIVTPDFHHLHHCSEQRFTDSNYSAAVPWFDYLFGTATRKPYAEHETMELGLERFRAPLDSRVDQILLMPFRGERYRTSPLGNPQSEPSTISKL